MRDITRGLRSRLLRLERQLGQGKGVWVPSGQGVTDACAVHLQAMAVMDLPREDLDPEVADYLDRWDRALIDLVEVEIEEAGRLPCGIVFIEPTVVENLAQRAADLEQQIADIKRRQYAEGDEDE